MTCTARNLLMIVLGIAVVALCLPCLASEQRAPVDVSYAIVVKKSTAEDPKWQKVVAALKKKHNGAIVTYDGSVDESLDALKRRFPRYTCFVTKPEDAGRSFVAQVHRLSRKFDDDPYTDTFWGILTGYDAENALTIASRSEPLVVSKVASGTEFATEMVVEGHWYDELVKNKHVKKEPGGKAQQLEGPDDTTKPLVDLLNEYKPDLMITSGHATERDWQIGFRFRSGQFRCSGGRLFGLDTQGTKHPIDSPNPKVYMPIGNCLMGHIIDRDAMALAWMNSAGVTQMLGYTIPTGYGYGGWGCLDYFVEQPGRYTFAEAFLANHHALIHRMNDPTTPMRDRMRLRGDRDVVAFYGDPRWSATMAERPKYYDQTLRIEDGTYTLTITPNRGKESFEPVNTNGSQRGGRPMIQFLPHRIKDAKVIAGADLNPVVTDDFILVPNPRVCDPNRKYVVCFTATRIASEDAAPEGLGSAKVPDRITQDWLYQTKGRPTISRTGREIDWARKSADRIASHENGPDLSAERKQLDELERRLLETDTREPKANSSAEKIDVDLYLAVRRVKRRIMMKDPLLDFSKIVMVDVPCYDALNHESMHRVFPQAQNNVGRLIMLDGLDPEGKVTDLTGRPGMFWRPDVSFDGRRVLFCMRPKGERTFHLYEKDLENGQIRQITDGKYDDLDPIYMPDGHITFLSNRGNSYARCAVAHPSYVVSRCDADGKNLYILSMGTEPEYTPTLLADGRVMYTRWEYTDKELFRIQSLWTMNPDGTNVAALWGNQSYWPDMLVEARPIPGSRRIIFSGQGHHDIVHGSIGMIDPTEGFNYPDGLTRVTADRPWAEVGNGPAEKLEKADYHASGRFDGYRCPYPLSETLFLVSAKLPHAGDPTGVGSAKRTAGRFSLYLMDVWGNRELLYAGEHDILYAMPVRPRPVPRTIQNRVAWPKQGEEARPGVLYSNDVFEGVSDELRDKAKFVRVIHQDYTTFTFGLKCQMPDHNGVKGQRGDQHAGPPLTIASNDGIKRILGTVPIESDGSIAIEVPPCVAIHFQLLDDQYRAVHVMRSFTGVMPGEQRGCVGCHESQGNTPVAGAHSIALRKGPVRPTPPPWGPRYHLGYRQDIQPILDRYCGKCHQGDGEGREKLDLTFRPSTDGGSYTEPYLTLTLGTKRRINRFAKTLCGGGAAGTLLPMASGFTPEHDVTLPPMTAMSYKSQLVANATSGKHHDVRVDPLSARKLIAWVDLLCPYWNEDDIRAVSDPDPADPYFANSAYPPRTPGVKPFADSPYPPRMKNAPIVRRAYCQDRFPTQEDRLREMRVAGER